MHMSDWRQWIGKSSTSTAQLYAAQANHMALMLDREPRFQAGDERPPAWHWLYFHDLAKASDLGAHPHPDPAALARLQPIHGSLPFTRERLIVSLTAWRSVSSTLGNTPPRSMRSTPGGAMPSSVRATRSTRSGV